MEIVVTLPNRYRIVRTISNTRYRSKIEIPKGDRVFNWNFDSLDRIEILEFYRWNGILCNSFNDNCVK